MPAIQSETSGRWVYKAEFDKDNNYNDAPTRCSACGHRYFRVSVTSWICDSCETKCQPDTIRNKRYLALKEQKRKEAEQKRGKRAKSKQAIEDELNAF